MPQSSGTKKEGRRPRPSKSSTLPAARRGAGGLRLNGQEETRASVKMHILRRGSQHGTFAARAAAQAYCIEPVHAARIRRQRSGRTRFIAGGAVWTSARIRLGSRRVI